jgi:hypothetical protein
VNAAFYCVSDARYFLGAVAMINSLRLQGHDQPVYLLDCGLTEAQRELLAPQVRVFPAPAGTAPYLLKTVLPLAEPAPVAVLIDADMIATSPLDELIASAAEGLVVAFRNDTDRHVPEWGGLLELGSIRRRPYVSSGLVALGGEEGGEVLRLLDDRQRRVDMEETFYGRNSDGYAFLYPEQDVLNAILCSRPAERALALDHRLAPNPPFDGLRLLDEERLRCAYADGAGPYVLHHYLRKPWLEPMYHGVYSRLLARLLLGDDVAIRVPAEQVPRRMRPGVLARLERARVDAIDLLGWRLRGALPRASVARLDERRRRRSAART